MVVSQIVARESVAGIDIHGGKNLIAALMLKNISAVCIQGL